MKKTLFLTLFMVLVLNINQVHSEPTCIEGTLITANSPDSAGCTAETCNGRTFCKSNVGMNWFSAWTWCKSQGRRLARFEVMCPGVTPALNYAAGACPNLQGVYTSGNTYVWSSYGWGSNTALLVNLSSGAVYIGYRGSSVCALCE